MIGALVVKFLKGRWGSVLPAILRAAAEGQFGPQVKAIYWFAAGYKTVTGAVLIGAAAGLGTLCETGGATYSWACGAQPWVLSLGAILAGVGLVDGGTRAPWPEGTPKEPAK